MFAVQYPNLELLEYKANQLLQQNEDFLEKYNAAKEKNKYVSVNLDAHVFPQIWGSTCLGFDVMPDGSPAIGGCAMTKAYTTVFHESSISDTYIIFFGGNYCYAVNNASHEFIEDLRNHNLCPYSKAKVRY